jgi:hypothetical protein
LSLHPRLLEIYGADASDSQWFQKIEAMTPKELEIGNVSAENQNKPFFTLVRADQTNLREVSIELSKKLRGREPTPEELEELDARIDGMRKNDTIDNDP